MEIGIPAGGPTRILGKSQGYRGLPVRDEAINCKVNGITNSMLTAWIPSPAELAALNKGATIHIRLIGTQHPPIIVEVGPIPSTE